jgi:transcriptional antiterminator
MVVKAPFLNARQRSIIDSLLRADGRMTLAELAKATGFSARIIRYNMDVVRAWLQRQKVEFVSRPGFGFEILTSKTTRKQLLVTLNQLEDTDIILTHQQRVRIILLNLLTSRESLSASRLADIENISRSTIFKDLHEIETWLADFDMRLMRQTNRGMWLECQEPKRRFALLRLVRQEIGDGKWHLMSGYYKTGNKYSDQSISSRLENYINTLPLNFTRRLISKVEVSLGRTMALRSRVEIMVYLAIAIQAMQEGRFICGEVDPGVEKSIEMDVARLVSYDIAEKIGQSVPPCEIELIAAYLLGCKWANSSSSTLIDEDYEREINEETLQISRDIASLCSMQLHPLLKIDPELIEGLAGHLGSSMFRIKYGIPIRNQFHKETRERYPEVYRSAEDGAKIIEKFLGKPVPPAEIGHLTMYLAAALERLRTEQGVRHRVIIASDGIRANPTLLKSRLEYEFPQLQIIQIMNNFDWDQDPEFRADVIISILPLSNLTLPVIEVSPFLDEDDINAVQKWLNDRNREIRQRSLISQQKTSLVDLLKTSHILIQDELDTWQEVVQAACLPLVRDHDIDERYIRATLNIIDEHGAFMGLAPGMMLLHAKPTDGVNQLCLSLMKLRKPVIFRDSEIGPVDIVAVLGAVDSHSHLTALFQLYSLVQNHEFMADLRASLSPADILRTVWRWLPNVRQYHPPQNE